MGIKLLIWDLVNSIWGEIPFELATNQRSIRKSQEVQHFAEFYQEHKLNHKFCMLTNSLRVCEETIWVEKTFPLIYFNVATKFIVVSIFCSDTFLFSLIHPLYH